MLHESNKQPPTLSGLKQQSFAFGSCCIFISSWQGHLLIVSHLDTQANGQSPPQKLLVRAPEGKVSCEGSCTGLKSTQNWYIQFLSPIYYWPELVSCPHPNRGAENATLHVLEGIKTRNIWLSVPVITQYAKSKAGIKGKGKYEVWRKTALDICKSTGLRVQRQRLKS